MMRGHEAARASRLPRHRRYADRWGPRPGDSGHGRGRPEDPRADSGEARDEHHERAAFYTLQRNRYFRKGGELVTDLGPVAAFLSYASGREAETLGKPSPLLFDSIAEDAGVRRAEIAMVGDDAEFDVSASVALGMA